MIQLDLKTFLIVDNDLIFDSNLDLAMAEGQQEEAQAIERALTTDINEWFLSSNHGLDYSHINTKLFDEERARLEVINTIYQDPRIETVESVDFEFLQDEEGEQLLSIRFKAKMQGRDTFIQSEVKSNGYIVPVTDSVSNLLSGDDYMFVMDGADQIIDLGFVSDPVETNIDYEII